MEWSHHNASRPTVRQNNLCVGMRDRISGSFASQSGVAGRSDWDLLAPLQRGFYIRAGVRPTDSEGRLTHR